MTFWRCIILLQFTTMLALGQLAQQSKPPSMPKRPEAMVRNFYKDVVARHPVSIPWDADMKVFAPYLSKALLHKIDLAIACGDDWHRQYPDPNLKPPLAWLEMGLFTGGNEKASPYTFRVEKAQSEIDGSFRVYVRFTWKRSDPWNWRTAAIVVQEGDRFVTDDIVFLKDEYTGDDEYRLSETLAAGCDGPRWVGYPKQRNDLKQPR